MITKDEDDGRHGLKRYATFIRQTKDWSGAPNHFGRMVTL
jgi:hypothetical protein